MGKNIQAILFDIGWTLIYPYPTREEANEKYLQNSGYTFSSEDLEPAHSAAANFYRTYRWLPESMQNNAQFWQEYYTIFTEQLGISKPGLPKAFIDYVTKSIKFYLYPETLPTLRELRKRGFLIGAVSNWSSKLPGILDDLGLVDYFDPLVVSDLIGYHKPQAEIFRYALNSLGVDASEVVHIGDNLEADVEGARQVGIRPIWLDRGSSSGDDYPDRIQSLTELLNFFI